MLVKSYDGFKYREVWVCTERTPSGVWLEGKAIGFCRQEVAAEIERISEKFRFASLSTRMTREPDVKLEPFFNDRLEILGKAEL